MPYEFHYWPATRAAASSCGWRWKRPARPTSNLRSERRIAFNQQGIFRRYPELDG